MLHVRNNNRISAHARGRVSTRKLREPTCRLPKKTRLRALRQRFPVRLHKLPGCGSRVPVLTASSNSLHPAGSAPCGAVLSNGAVPVGCTCVAYCAGRCDNPGLPGIPLPQASLPRPPACTKQLSLVQQQCFTSAK